MAPGTGVTQIDATYLNNLKTQLTDLQAQVEQQLHGLGTKGATPDTISFIEPVTASLHVLAGTGSFDAGTELNAALKAMGGSVHDQLTWLHKILGDMISEITATVNSFNGAESLNNEGVDKLISDFQHTIGDFSNTPGSTPSSSPSSSPA